METIQEQKQHHKKISIQVPLDNLVDKDVQSMLFPLNLMQNILFCPKYRIKDNYIHPNNLISKLMSLCAMMIFTFLFVYRVYKLGLEGDIRKDLNVTYISSYFDVISFGIGFIMNYVVNVLQTKINISFVLKLQEVHRYLNEKVYFKRFIIWNWISIILTSGFYLNIITFSNITLWLPTYEFCCGLVLLIFEINFVYAIRLIKLLSSKVDLWNIQSQYLQRMDHSDNEIYCKRMFQAYVNILKCYEIYTTYFRYMIIFHTFELFFHVIIKFQISLTIYDVAASSGMYQTAYLTITCLYMWTIKSWIFEIILSLCCEKFYIAMNCVQNSCALILGSNCTDAEKKICKNIIRLHRATFDKFDICGMFYIDATFPLKMIALTSNYTIVLLQFALL